MYLDFENVFDNYKYFLPYDAHCTIENGFNFVFSVVKVLCKIKVSLWLSLITNTALNSSKIYIDLFGTRKR